MDNSEAALPLEPPVPQEVAIVRPLVVSRWVALFQAFSVCGIPTQLAIATALMLGGNMQPFEQGQGLSLEFFATLSLLDTAVVALLIRVFLELSGESSRDVFLGRRPVLGEAVRGLLLLPVVFLAVTGIVVGLRYLVPSLHTVQQSPLESFMRSPLEAAIFLVVVVLAGGVREELQRAFILHRFDQSLGGVRVGLVIFSLTFAALHIDQGYDVALAIGALGLAWGVIYARRRSAVMPMVNHACFNAAQVAQQVIARSLGF